MPHPTQPIERGFLYCCGQVDIVGRLAPHWQRCANCIGAVVDVAKSWLVPRVGYWQRTNAANYCQELGTAKSWLLHQTRCTMQLDCNLDLAGNLRIKLQRSVVGFTAVTLPANRSLSVCVLVAGRNDWAARQLPGSTLHSATHLSVILSVKAS